ncbi:hypothetical protein [Neorhizobium sp. NCHU2750]|uniref:hypothetical protein n=1 Tax=Neorhizobium sp. NCHU2750 TaxID=1825976 RepID=UPI000EB6C31B|nr:hypothetical protein NCHU2750_45140 [Neorhizobium sp. NCHU2750]
MSDDQDHISAGERSISNAVIGLSDPDEGGKRGNAAGPARSAEGAFTRVGGEERPEAREGEDAGNNFKSGRAGLLPPDGGRPAYDFQWVDAGRGLDLLEIASSLAEQGLTFMRHLLHIAGSVLGEGLDERPQPIVGIALRSLDMAPLLALTQLLSGYDEDKLTVINYRGDLAAGNSPGLLAEALLRHHDAGHPTSETILFILPDAMRTLAWERATLCGDDPLSHLLRRLAKRLIIGFEAGGAHPLSRLVNADTRIMPLPWALPAVLLHTDRHEFSPRRIDGRLLLTMSAATAWHGSEDDRRERGRFQQLTTGLEDTAGAMEFQSRLESLLADDSYDIEAIWQMRGRLVSEAFGLLPLAQNETTEFFPCGPAVLRQAILFTVAFCKALPGHHFMKIVRASVDMQTQLKPSEILPQDRADLPELPATEDAKVKPAPAMPILADCFERYFDRLCREYDIVVNDGYLRLSGKWADFPLASFIGQNAPIQAASLAHRLMANMHVLDLQSLVEHAALIDILALAKIHLPASFDDELLVKWLTEHTFRPLLPKLQQAANIDVLAQDIRMSNADSAGVIANIMQADNSERMARYARDAGWQMAKTITLFSNACRQIADTNHIRRNSGDEEAKLLAAIIGYEDWVGNFVAGLSLGMLLMDMQPPGKVDRRELYALVRRFVRRDDPALRAIRSIISQYLDTRANVLGGAFGPLDQAHRVLRVLAGGDGDLPEFWGAMSVTITELLLNFDIRWPPSDGELLAYEEMRRGRRYTAPVLICGDRRTRDGHEGLNVEGSYVLERLATRFFACSPALWLDRSLNRQAIEDAGHRLRDCIYVLLDGVPQGAKTWRLTDKSEHEARVLRALCINSGARPLAGCEELSVSLADIHDFSELLPSEEAMVRLYGLFWSAVLLHWRFQLFDVSPLAAGSEDAECLAGALAQLTRGVPRGALAGLIDGLGILQTVTRDALEHHALALGDQSAARFYAAKADAIGKLKRHLGRQGA